MKVKMKRIDLATAKALPAYKRKKLKKPSMLFRILIRLLSTRDLGATKFRFEKKRMKLAGKGPYFILMNHSSFIDLKIANRIFFPMPYHIVTTMDGFIGKDWLLREIGCIPTQKFTADVQLAKTIMHLINDVKRSVLMFPEAGYSLDGTTTTLPNKMGAMLKRLNADVITVITDGAYLRQPLYNNLHRRKVNTSATVTCLFTQQELQEKSAEEIDEAIAKQFSFDNFQSQWESKTVIDEPYRAEGLHRLLYRCPRCQSEGKTLGEGVTLTCQACGAQYTLTEYGRMQALDGNTEFPHIPDWFSWERQCVKEELLNDEYRLQAKVDICLVVDSKAVYTLGEGTLTHDKNGFVLTDEQGDVVCTQAPLASHSVNVDYNWYEIGDIVSIGDRNKLYYCIFKEEVPVTKARFGAEELYKMLRKKMREK